MSRTVQLIGQSLAAAICVAIAWLALRYLLPSGSCLLSEPPQCSRQPGPIGTATAITFGVFALLFVISALRTGWRRSR